MYRREPAQQHWPWLKKIALAAPGIAASRSASANTMLGDLPPSSSETRLRLSAAAWTISLPTSVEPVNATLSTPGWAAIAAPAVSPKPVTMFTTPAGSPASWISSPSRSARQRRLLGGLEYDRAAGRERRAELPGGHQQREVPRDDLTDDADRLAAACRRGTRAPGAYGTEIGNVSPVRSWSPTRPCTGTGRRPAARRRRGPRQRLAVVERLDRGQLVGVLEDQLADPPDDPASLGSRHPAPVGVLQSPAGGEDRQRRRPRRRRPARGR